MQVLRLGRHRPSTLSLERVTGRYVAKGAAVAAGACAGFRRAGTEPQRMKFSRGRFIALLAASAALSLAAVMPARAAVLAPPPTQVPVPPAGTGALMGMAT